MSKFELLKHETFSELVEHTYFIQYGEDKIVYKEWMEGHKVIDFTLRDKDGYEIDDPELLEQVHEFIEALSVEP